MALVLTIRLPGTSVWTDYSDFLFPFDASTATGGADNPPQNNAAMTKQWEVNQKPTLDFILAPDEADVPSFVIPPRGSEIRVDCDTYPNFFTGFINSEPEPVPCSSDQNEIPIIGFSYRATGEEILCDMSRVGFVPDYVNAFDGDIIADLIARLVPGRFDTSALTGFGDPEPVFVVHPDLRFVDIMNSTRSLFLQKSVKLWFQRGAAFIARLDERPFNNPSFRNWTAGPPEDWTIASGTVTEETVNVVRDYDAANFGSGGGVLTQPVTDPTSLVVYIATGIPYQVRVFAQATASDASLSIQLDGNPGLSLASVDLLPSMTIGPGGTPQYMVFEGELTAALGSVPSNLVITGTDVLVGQVDIYPGPVVFDWAVVENDLNFQPFYLNVKPVQSPIRNDITGIGDVEPQVYVREYAVADGVVTSFPLRLPPFGTNGQPLVADNLDQGQFAQNLWNVVDPSGAFTFVGGSLNVLGGLGLDATTAYLQQGIEIKDKRRVQAGQFNFQGSVDGIVGALYDALPPLSPGSGDGTALTRVLLGWRLTPATGPGTVTVTDEVPLGLSANELPTGAIDGSNTVFVAKNIPIAQTVQLQVNGITLLAGTDYTLPGGSNAFTLAVAPFAGSEVLVTYNFIATAADGVSTSYSTQEIPISGSVTITLDGTLLAENVDYQLEGNDIIFTTAPPAGGAILVSYQYMSGGQTQIQPLVLGQAVGDIITTRDAKTYAMEMEIDAVGNLFLQPWYSLHSQFGGGSQTAPILVTFRVVEYDQLDVKLPQIYQTYQVTLLGGQLPAFVFAGPFAFNNVDVGLTVNGVQILEEIQGTLLTQAAPISVSPVQHRTLGFVGEEDADATVTVQDQGAQLAFFQETRPSGKTRVEFRYRSAGLAVARLIDSRSIADEAFRYGDSGVRAVILFDISPPPANAQDLESAIQAMLEDGTLPQYGGDWFCYSPQEYEWPSEPIPGRFLTFYSPSMLSQKGFEALVRVVKTDVYMVDDGSGVGSSPVTDAGAEMFRHTFQFGEITTRNLERTLNKLSKRQSPPEEAVIQQTIDVQSVDTTQIAEQYIKDVTGMFLTGFDPTNFYFDIGEDLPVVGAGAGGGVLTIFLSANGTGYVTGDHVALIDATGTGCVIEVTASGGLVFGGTVISAGTGYAVTYIPDNTTAITGSGTGCQFTVTGIASAPPITAQIEVRWSDTTWGQSGGANLIGRFTNRQFALPRKRRDQWAYAKFFTEGGISPLTETFSRYSGMCEMQYPLVPAAPLGVDVNLSIPSAPVLTAVLPAAQYCLDLFGILIMELSAIGASPPIENLEGVALVSDGPDTRTAIVYGLDIDGNPINETIVLNGTTVVNGSVPMSVVGAVQFSLLDNQRTVTALGGPGNAFTIGVMLPGQYSMLFGNQVYRYEDASFGGAQDDPALSYEYTNPPSRTGFSKAGSTPAATSPAVFAVFFYNTLDELSPPIIVPVELGGSAAGECLDVRDFGAVGDGVTNDTAAVQKALDQAYMNSQILLGKFGSSPLGGGGPTKVCVPSGVVTAVGGDFWGTTIGTSWPDNPHAASTIQGAVFIKSGVTLQVDGGMILLPWVTNPTYPYPIYSDTLLVAFDPANAGDLADNVTLTGVGVLDGNRDNQTDLDVSYTGLPWTGAYFNVGTNCTITGTLTIQNCGNLGVAFIGPCAPDQASSGSSITGCTITTCGNTGTGPNIPAGAPNTGGLRATCSGLVINNIFVSDCVGGPLGTQSMGVWLSGNNITLANSQVTGCGTAYRGGIGTGYDGATGSHNIKIVNNQVQHNFGTGIFVLAAPGIPTDLTLDYIDGIEIGGNNVSGTAATPTAQPGYGILVNSKNGTGTYNNVSIHDNTCTTNAAVGIAWLSTLYFVPLTSQCANCNISNNILQSNGGGQINIGSGTNDTIYTLAGLTIVQITQFSAVLQDGSLYKFTSGIQSNETPSGAVNGSNKDYVLTYAPNPTTSLQLFFQPNGSFSSLLIQGVDYTLSGANITTTNAQNNGAYHAWYQFTATS